MGKKGPGEERRRILNMTEMIYLEADGYDRQKFIERATAIMRRVEALAKLVDRTPLDVFKRFPAETQETIAHLFDSCELEDPSLVSHLPATMKEKLVNFKALVMPYVEVVDAQDGEIQDEVGSEVEVTSEISLNIVKPASMGEVDSMAMPTLSLRQVGRILDELTYNEVRGYKH